MRVFHMKPATKHRLMWTNRPSFDQHNDAFRDAFVNGGYVEVGQFPGEDIGLARTRIAGVRPTEPGDIITDGNSLYKVESGGETYVGAW